MHLPHPNPTALRKRPLGYRSCRINDDIGMGNEIDGAHALRFHFNGWERLVRIIQLFPCTRQISPSGSYAAIRVRRSIRSGALLFWLASSLAWTVVRFDAVSVWIDDEGSVIVGPIYRT